jgi:hypothetical protein
MKQANQEGNIMWPVILDTLGALVVLASVTLQIRLLLKR